MARVSHKDLNILNNLRERSELWFHMKYSSTSVFLFFFMGQVRPLLIQAKKRGIMSFAEFFKQKYQVKARCVFARTLVGARLGKTYVNFCLIQKSGKVLVP